MSSAVTENKATAETTSAGLMAAMQAEVAGLRVQVASMQDAIVNLTHENTLLKRRLYGNKTEKSRTSELQLTLGNLLDSEKELTKELEQAAKVARDAAESETEDDPCNPPSEKRASKPTGRRDLSVSSLPKVPVEIIDPELEHCAKRIGHDVSYQLIYRRGGFAVLVRQVVVWPPLAAVVFHVPPLRSYHHKG